MLNVTIQYIADYVIVFNSRSRFIAVAGCDLVSGRSPAGLLSQLSQWQFMAALYERNRYPGRVFTRRDNATRKFHEANGSISAAMREICVDAP
jgi:hypothetical protein